METDYVIVLVTTSGKQEAEKIVNHLLTDRLIACANIVGPITSIYRWSGTVEGSEEYLVLMKSKKDLFGRLTEVVRTTHSYQVPEILAVPIVEGSKPYLEWLESCLT